MKWKKWSYNSLPILPEKLEYKENKKTRSQLKIILRQLKRKDIERVVVATDAGREGELIARTIINRVGGIDISKCYRFWTSEALNKSVVLKEMDNLRPLADYNRLFYAAIARQMSDWLVGMNMSRLATLKLGDLYSVGRVQTAVLAFLVERAREIREFVPVPYFLLDLDLSFSGGDIRARWFNKEVIDNNTRLYKKEDLAKIKAKISIGDEAKVSSVAVKKNVQSPPSLYSLTELQRDANKRYGLSAKKTLTIAQSLYEKYKCLSYPRTDATVLGKSTLPMCKKILNAFEQSHEDYFQAFDESLVSTSNFRVFNDSKLTDHHALIPLKQFNGNPMTDEGKIFDLVLRRFLMVFSKNYIEEETNLRFLVSGESFKARGKSVIQKGWKHLGNIPKDVLLGVLKKGDLGEVKQIKEELTETKPPFDYTDSSLLRDMINPARLVSDQAIKKIFRGEVGIGTQATRAEIIETLIMRKYVIRAGKLLKATKKGEFLIDNIRAKKISSRISLPEETGKWELSLSEIANGKGDLRVFLDEIKTFVVSGVSEWAP